MGRLILSNRYSADTLQGDKSSGNREGDDVCTNGRHNVKRIPTEAVGWPIVKSIQGSRPTIDHLRSFPSGRQLVNRKKPLYTKNLEITLLVVNTRLWRVNTTKLMVSHARSHET